MLKIIRLTEHRGVPKLPMLTCMGWAAKASWGPFVVSGGSKESAGISNTYEYGLVPTSPLRRRKHPKHSGVRPRTGIVLVMKVLA